MSIVLNDVMKMHIAAKLGLTHPDEIPQNKLDSIAAACEKPEDFNVENVT